MRRLAVPVVMALLSLFAVAGCGKTITAPNVVGLALDKAHQQFQKLGAKDFNDKDYFGSRSVLLDRDWAVIEQSPAAGTSIKTGTKVTLKVGKISESKTIDALPSTSPIKISALKSSADEAAKKAAAQAAAVQAHKAALQTYVNALDPTLRVAENTLVEMGKLGSEIQSGEISGVAIDQNVEGADTAIDQLTTLLNQIKPTTAADRDASHAALIAAAASYEQAAQTLLSADGYNAVDALSRFSTVVSAARIAWNGALTSTYAETSVRAPLVP